MEMVEIKCRCKDCEHSVKEGKTLRCYYWDYETGMGANVVNDLDFCSNGKMEK